MKLGILGTGYIAEMVAPALAALPEITCYAAASRTPGKAEAFAREHGFEKACTSYEEMLSDPEVELVYVATPHSHHFEHMMLCLEYGKHVICEKAFALNARQAEAVFAAAKQKGLYVAEAIWTRYMPSMRFYAAASSASPTPSPPICPIPSPAYVGFTIRPWQGARCWISASTG